MTTTSEAFQAAVDAVVLNNTLNKSGFADAIRTVVAQAYTDAEAKAWIDALAILYESLGLINNPTYSSFRNKIVADPVLCVQLFNALAVALNELPETGVINSALSLIDLRVERDEVQTSIDTLAAFKTGATKQVKDALQLGIDQLRSYKESVRAQIKAITGDPDN